MNNPDDGFSGGNDGSEYAALPSRRGSMSRHVSLEARAEIRDRETYYAELRYAVHCQSRCAPVPGTWMPHLPDTWT
jgi:hypothetical protein